MINAKLVTVGKTRKTFHRAMITIEGKVQAVTLCNRVWSDNIMSETDLNAMTECKLCHKAWKAAIDAHWAEVAAQRETADKIDNEAPQGSDQGFSDSEDNNSGCEPVYPSPVEIVIFNGREYELNYWQRDQLTPGDVDADWLNLRAVDGSGSVTVQRRDLDPVVSYHVGTETALVKITAGASVADLLSMLDTNPWTPALPSVVIPAQRRPIFTPADMDALNLRRRVGAKVRVKGDTGLGRVARVVARNGSTPPAVVVRFSDGFTVEYALSEVMLSA